MSSMKTFILCMAVLHMMLTTATASDLISGFVPGVPILRDMDSVFDPYDNFNLLTKSMRQLTRFADRIASTLAEPAPEAIDRKGNASSVHTKLGRLTLQENNLELKLHPRVDWQETHDGFVLTASTPGLRKEDLSIEIVEASGAHYIEISGQTSTSTEAPPTAETSKELAKPLVLRTSYQSFNHKVRLPPGVDRDSLKAKYENGLLVVTMQNTHKADIPRQKIKIA
jgi:HSP20 family molecular chaperone IbpA